MSPEHTQPLPAAVFPRFRPSAGTARVAMPCLLAAAIVLLQTWAVPLVTHLPYADARRELVRWDSVWYARLAETGYISSLPRTSFDGLTMKQINDGTNVAFFPAYPLFIRFVRAAGLSTTDAMLLVSQAAAVAMWMYLLLLLRRLRVPGTLQAAVVALAAAHPGAFFQVAPYSESLFLASLLGFVYWTLDRRTPAAPGIASVHGALMSATKLVGLPVALLPLVLALWRRFGARIRGTPIGPAALDALLAVSGGVAFLLFCQLRFGHWNLYMLRQEAGWGIHPDPFFFLRWPPTFLIPQITQPLAASPQIGRFVTAATGWMLVACLAGDIRRALRGKVPSAARLALLWCAGCTFFVFTATFTGLGMEAMLRHAYTPYVLLLVLLAQAASGVWRAAWRRHEHALVLLCGAACCGMLAVQLDLLARFVAWQWVA